MEALGSLAEVANWLPFVMTPDEEREAQGALITLSDEARMLGSALWTSPATAPRSICNLVIKAVVRHMKNPDGYTQSRAGDESISWTDRGEFSGSASFTSREMAMIRQTAGTTPALTAPMSAWGTSPNGRRSTGVGLVPDAGSLEMIQMFSSDTEPW